MLDVNFYVKSLSSRDQIDFPSLCAKSPPCGYSVPRPRISSTSFGLAMSSSTRNAPASWSISESLAPCASNVVFHSRTSPHTRQMISKARAREGVSAEKRLSAISSVASLPWSPTSRWSMRSWATPGRGTTS